MKPSTIGLVAAGALLAGIAAMNRSRLPFYAEASMAARYAMGQVQGCTLQEALAEPDNTKRLFEVADRLRSQSHLEERDQAGFERWSTPQGSFWIPDVANKAGLPLLLAMMELDVYTAQLPIQPGDVVLDCGAHVGVFVRKALAQGASVVVAIEPVAENVEALRRNFAAEIQAGRVIVHPAGVWDRKGSVPLQFDPTDSLVHSMVLPVSGQGQSRTVAVTTIDELVQELHLPKVSFLKFNIEGAEQRALLGARKTLASFRPRIAVAPYHLEDDQVKIPEIIRSAAPEYRMTAGDCGHLHERFRPQVLYFQ